MSVGMIFECGPQGADKQVCEYLAEQLRPGVALMSRTMDNKPNLLQGAAPVAAALLASGCERVLIVWDLRPAWPDKKHKPCRAAECATLLQGLADQGLHAAPVYLVCIEQELESWMLADEGKLSDFLSTPAHRCVIQRVRRPDQQANPKSRVNNCFVKAKGHRYDDRIHAIKVMRTSPPPNWDKLRRSVSFARFEAMLTQELGEYLPQ